jgi:hypothetical protein
MNIILTIFILVALVAGIIAAESGSAIFSTGVLISFFVILDIVFDVMIWSAIVTNPLTIIALLLAYLTVGAAYTAVWQWPESLRESAEAIQNIYADWKKNNQTRTRQDFMRSYEYQPYTASRNSEKLVNWIIIWPFSLFWELARKPVKFLATNVYNTLSKTFTDIGQQVTNNILKDK